METSKSALRALPERTRALFDHIRAAPGIERFLLVGGTALALRLQHRLSEDLDFLTPSRLDRGAINSVLQHLHDRGCRLTRLAKPFTALQFDMEGADAEDYGQDWRVDDVKLTFHAKRVEPATAQTQLEQVLQAAALDGLDPGRIRIASEACIFALKCQLLQERLLTRDLYDLKTLIETGRYSIEQMLEEGRRLGANAEFVKERIFAGRLRKDDPGVNTLAGEQVDPVWILAWFAEQLNEMERRMAEKAARQHR